MFDNNFWTGVKRYRDNIFIFMTRGSFNTRRVFYLINYSWNLIVPL